MDGQGLAGRSGEKGIRAAKEGKGDEVRKVTSKPESNGRTDKRPWTGPP